VHGALDQHEIQKKDMQNSALDDYKAKSCLISPAWPTGKGRRLQEKDAQIERPGHPQAPAQAQRNIDITIAPQDEQVRFRVPEKYCEDSAGSAFQDSLKTPARTLPLRHDTDLVQ
jgi:hypothetical protein